ncbi:hypothetical protein CMUS01_10238 [Colletotrichum musicola]|uniref:Uncharacterized protein n=1 Tax=Colletotrichum musicola TaxID=2175873 RepID=A0A8H6K497_9PEZI|nr:hypothetical protein CMUS01_10238 [Colletotrichum musicola]
MVTKERVPAACPPGGALVTDDLPRRLELLEELKNVSVHRLGGSGNGRIDEKKFTPYAWAAFLVALMEGLEEMLENVRDGSFPLEFLYSILNNCRDQLPRLIKLCNSGVVPQLERIPESESSSSDYSPAAILLGESEEETPPPSPPESPPRSTLADAELCSPQGSCGTS